MINSFRDPDGRVFIYKDRVFRLVNKTGENNFKDALSSEILKNYVNSGNLVKTFEPDSLEAENLASELKQVFDFQKDEISLIVEHEKIPFQSYPYEWSSEMLHAAAQLTLDLHQNLLSEGMGLKDAAPYNILFRGVKPVFVDWLSFEKRDVLDSVWLAQAQFLRTFLLPLLVNKNFHFGLASIFRVRRDGVTPQEVYEMFGGIKKFLPPFLTMVTIPKFLAEKYGKNNSVYQQGKSENAERAAFILNHQCNYLRRLLKKVSPKADATSDWSEYIGANQHFTDEYLKHKETFVRKVFEEYKPQNVLDIGCNTGFFSRIAAKSGSSVISIDQDEVAVGRVFRMAKEENLDILPLIQDIARPSPGLGWRNGECPSFLDRARGKMDAVMMLAVIHHLLVNERIPLAEILNLAGEITRDILIVEFVPPGDPMFKTIARGRDHLFQDLTEEKFREACQREFKIIRSEKLAQSERSLYLLRK